MVLDRVVLWQRLFKVDLIPYSTVLSNTNTVVLVIFHFRTIHTTCIPIGWGYIQSHHLSSSLVTLISLVVRGVNTKLIIWTRVYSGKRLLLIYKCDCGEKISVNISVLGVVMTRKVQGQFCIGNNVQLTQRYWQYNNTSLVQILRKTGPNR